MKKETIVKLNESIPILSRDELLSLDIDRLQKLEDKFYLIYKKIMATRRFKQAIGEK